MLEFSFFFLFQYSCFTMLFVSSVQQSELDNVYIYPVFFGFLSHFSHCEVLSRFSCAIQSVLTCYLFYI